MYALHAYQKVEETLDVVTGMLKVYDFDVYELLYARYNLSFVTFLPCKLIQCMARSLS